MAVAIFGGSFDPFHKAHKAIIKHLIADERFSKVYIIPAGIPPHKGGQHIEFSSYRFLMLEKALAKYEKVSVLDFEIRKESSYTVDTIRYFQTELCPNEELYFVMGSDSLLQIESWRDPAYILKNVHLLVQKRPGDMNEKTLDAKVTELEKHYASSIEFFVLPPMDISSTKIRAQLAKGDLEIPQLPKKVLRFIKENYLYQDEVLDSFTPEQMNLLRSYERILMTRLSWKRIIHSLNVMYEAVRLARRFAVDPWKASVAGLLHDSCKEKFPEDYKELLEEIDEDTKASPSIWHGPFAASYVRMELGIQDQEILDAISYHSSLSPNPSVLEQIIFLADKIEISRDYEDLEEIRKMAQVDLDKALCMTIDGTFASLERQGKKPHPFTLEARKTLRCY